MKSGVVHRRRRRLIVAMLTGLSGAACQTASMAPDAPPALAASDLQQSVTTFSGMPLVVPSLHAPDHLRPCCTFGHDLKVRYAGIPIPLFRLGNIADPQDLGRHIYDGGSRGFVGDYVGSDAEKSGLVYTRRGGFVDLAHVRDSADNTLFLLSQIWPRLGQSWTLAMNPELTDRRIEFRAFTPPVAVAERYALAATLAAHLAFQLAVWHEIAQWYGYRSVHGFSERSSAFSPEDLYSNALGARLALIAALQGAAGSEDDFNAAMTQLLPRALMTLQAEPPAATRDELDRLDGCWWNHHVRLPRRFLLLRRDYDVATQRLPLRPESETTPALAISAPSSWNGQPLDDDAVFRLVPHASRHRLPQPPDEAGWTAADFPALAAHARQRDAAALEPRGRVPDGNTCDATPSGRTPSQ